MRLVSTGVAGDDAMVDTIAANSVVGNVETTGTALRYRKHGATSGVVVLVRGDCIGMR